MFTSFSLQIGVDAAGLHQYKGELVVSMKYIPSPKHPVAGDGRKGECCGSMCSVWDLLVAMRAGSGLGFLHGATAGFPSAVLAMML